MTDGNLWECEGYKYEMVNLPFDSGYTIGIECLSFNQADTIRNALDSMLYQKTDYKYKIFVIDDASSDGTIEILKEYANKYPETIGLLISKENTFKKRMRSLIYKTARSFFLNNADYIASCEGDDYWTDENKLQIQVEYMRTHKECVMYLHNSWWIDCLTGKKEVANPFEGIGERDLTFEEIILIRNRHPATASRVFRNTLRLEAPDFLFTCPVGDYSLMTYAASIGTVHYSDKIMCAYRYMSNNSTTAMYSDEENRSYKIYHSIGIANYLIELDIAMGGREHTLISTKATSFIAIGAMEIKKLGKTQDEISEAIYPFRLELKENIKTCIYSLLKRIIDETYVSDVLKEYIAGHENFYIFGTGVYTILLIKQLCFWGIKPLGFIRSEASKGELFDNKPVWAVGNLPADINNNGVIVGVLPKAEDGVEHALCEAGITDYIFAYELNYIV